jgi:hypothetical protein
MGERNILNQIFILKKIFTISLAFLLCITTFAQKIKKVASLDSFFAGLPLQKSYAKWVEHINTHPYLGIDSVSKKGLYSSFKPGMKSHFPFPDSVKVKIMLFTGLNIDSSGRLPVDTVISAFIEGVFGNTRNAKKDADKCFNQLKSLLSKNYKIMNSDPSGYGVGFIKGINENFPDVILERGYFKEQDFYYVLLICAYNQRMSFKISIKNN